MMNSAATVVKLTSTAAGRILGQGALGMALTSKNGVATQVCVFHASVFLLFFFLSDIVGFYSTIDWLQSPVTEYFYLIICLIIH